MIVVLALLGCAPTLARMPGPLDRLGRGANESTGDYLARRRGPPEESAVAVAGGHTAAPSAKARDIVAAAASFVGASSLNVDGESFRYDCSGFVEASMAKAGLRWDGSSAMLYEAAEEAGVLHHRHLPRPGDVAFWDNTYDRDDNGQLDDAVTHSGIVADVESDGTIDIVHLGSRGVVHIKMNLKHPHDRLAADGTVINDYLRGRTGSDPWGTQYLAGELWSAFASFWATSAPVAERG